jgi:hypothetical protein
MRFHDSAEFLTDRVIKNETLASCKNHIDSIQNLRYLSVLEAESPQQVRLNLRMMEWHLNNLEEALFPSTSPSSS